MSVIMAAISLMAGTVLYLWAPEKLITPTAMAAYGLLVATTGSLVVTSGGVESPFIALWILISIFAGIFGVWGIVPLFIASSYYLFVAVGGSAVTQDLIVRTLAAGWLPLIASFIIWHGRKAATETNERAYRSLASELDEVANKAEVVINAIADGVIAIDQTGIIQLINPAAQQITGWGKQDATTLNYKSVLKLTDSKDVELVAATDPIQQVLSNNKEIRTNDILLVTNAGKKISISAVVSPVGQIGAGAIVVFRDITKEKAAEREQAEFISTASHEMRTPVASIEGYLSLALNPGTATIDEKARDFITKAHESTKHLGRLFQDLLDVSKTEDGRISNNPGVIDIIQFVHDLSEGLRPSAEAKNLRLVFKPIPDDEDKPEGGDRQLIPVYYVMADPDHFREVVSNLIENAIKYTLKGDVIVDVEGDGNHVTISIADSGIGIPLEDIPHLFQKFYRVDNTDTREIGGTGLGLYLSRRLVEVMEGRIWVESKYKEGSTFFIELPRISHEKATSMIELASQKTEAPAASLLPTLTPPSFTATTQPFIVTNRSNTFVEQVSSSPSADVIASQLQAVSRQTAADDDKSPHSATDILSAPHVNTPLTAIEQNPNKFTQPFDRTSVSVPNRDPTQQRQ